MIRFADVRPAPGRLANAQWGCAMTAEIRTGGCHCGAVRFEAAVDLDQAIQCNCSICSKAGFIWSFIPASQFTLTAAGNTTEYLFHKHAVHHRFCNTCGIEPFAQGEHPDGSGRMVAVNVRCLDESTLPA